MLDSLDISMWEGSRLRSTFYVQNWLEICARSLSITRLLHRTHLEPRIPSKPSLNSRIIPIWEVSRLRSLSIFKDGFGATLLTVSSKAV